MKRAGVAVFAAALAARLAVVLWAGSDFPASADGFYYHTFAERLASGAGYTWLWPDGAVTYAAHYPVGYPALLALAYLAFGRAPVVAGVFNALVGAFGALATRELCRGFGARRALFAGLAVALHPALVLYTPAIMTEGITTALVVSAAALAARRRLLLAGLVLGVATLVRPQSLLLAPLLGACSARGGWRALAAAGVTAIALVVCLPWTARNCERMHRCALVSVNAGWNLLIGTQTTSGAWQEVEVPVACREVWDEAEKDACFERAARAEIRARPLAWLARAPAKLRVTLDYFGAGPWYLHQANGVRFSERAKAAWGALETLASRALLLAALLVWTRRARVLGFVGALLALTDQAWLAYLALGLAVLGAGETRRPELFSALAILATAAVHACFFGAGRYGIVVVPFVAALAAARPIRLR